MWFNFHQEWSSKWQNHETSHQDKTALKSGNNCQNKESLQSPAIVSMHNQLNIGAHQFPELYAFHHHWPARCQMTLHYTASHNDYVIQRCATYLIASAKSECDGVFMTHLFEILASPSAWINTITPESSIAPSHSFSAPVSLLCIPNSLSPPVTATLLWRIFCKHSPDECIKGMLCLQFHLIDC